MKTRSFLMSVFIVIACSLAFPGKTVQAAQLTLAWDLNQETVTGYKIYYGTASRTYANSVSVGNTDHVTITGLDPMSGTYYFAATAYRIDGNSTTESDFSEEVSFTFVATSIVISDGTSLDGWIRTSGSGNAIVDVENGYIAFRSSSATSVTVYKISLSGLTAAENNVSWQAAWLNPLNSFFLIQINTTQGIRKLYYRPVDPESISGTSTNIYVGISSLVKDGAWHAFTRNLQNDLLIAQPNNNLLAIQDFYIYVYGLNGIAFTNLIGFSTVE